jgi:hypothetical protein
VLTTLGIQSRAVQWREDAPLLGGLFASTVISCAMMAFSMVYQSVSLALNKFENHRTATDFEDNLILKRFIFEFFNSFFLLFYVAFVKGLNLPIPFYGTEGDYCKDFSGNKVDNCMPELYISVGTLYIMRATINRALEMGTPIFMYRVKKFVQQNPRTVEWMCSCLPAGVLPPPKQDRTKCDYMTVYEDEMLMESHIEHPDVAPTFSDLNQVTIQVSQRCLALTGERSASAGGGETSANRDHLPPPAN